MMSAYDQNSCFYEFISTLKECSHDKSNNEYMTRLCYKAIDFDKFVEAYQEKLSVSNVMNSCDALILPGMECGYLIEFKNQKIDNALVYNVRKKIYDSLLVYTDIVKLGISFTRKNLCFVLVYSGEKERERILKALAKNAKEEARLGDFKEFENVYFKKVYTLNQDEFAQLFERQENL